MIHSMITHPPAVLQPDCSASERRHDWEGARLQAQCAFRLIVALFERLRNLGAYDVSSIVVVADHGYGFESRFAVRSQDLEFRRMVGAFNPVVLVKPAGSHGRLTTSDARIQLADVPKSLCGEADCSPSDGLRRLDAVDPGRTRTAFWYIWNNRYWNLPHIPGLVRYSIRGDLPRVASWSREAEAYEPGTAIEFRTGGNLGRYVGFGWGLRQKARTWMADAEATLWLRGRFEPFRDYWLVLEGRLRRASPAERVTVEVNGVEVGEVTFEPATRLTTYRFPVPASVLSRSPDTLILFSAKAGPDAGERPPEVRLAVKTVELRLMP
jgi:hypothetical protein